MFWEIATSFILGIALIALLCWLLKAKMKWYVRLLLSSAAGFAVLAGLSLFNVIVLPLNPLNVFITGFMGVPGLVLIYLIVKFL